MEYHTEMVEYADGFKQKKRARWPGVLLPYEARNTDDIPGFVTNRLARVGSKTIRSARRFCGGEHYSGYDVVRIRFWIREIDDLPKGLFKNWDTIDLLFFYLICLDTSDSPTLGDGDFITIPS